MKLEIVSPEAVIFDADVSAVSVPGINGEFQMLENHAPIVSLLTKGNVRIQLNNQDGIKSEDLNELITADAKDSSRLVFPIKSGTIELKDNKIIILAD